MRTPLLAMALVMASILITATARAEADGAPFISIARQPTGQPILVVDYPWQEYGKASIEIRQVASDEVDNWQVKPLFFVRELFNGQTSMAISRCLIAAGDTAVSAEFTQREIDFEILGDRNSFGSPSVSVACRTEYKPSGEEATVSRAVFPSLECWSPEKSKLYLDLPVEYFPTECKVRVWLLRGDKVVWAATVQWPGDSEEPANR